MFGIFLLFVPVWAVDFETLTQIRCFTLQGKLSKTALTCDTPIPEERNCSEFCNNEALQVTPLTDTSAFLDGTVAHANDQICETANRLRCGKKSGPIDDLCFTIIEESATYVNALNECTNRGGRLFIPDSDEDLKLLINLIDGKIKRFWIGGGTIFFPSCDRVKPNEDGIEPAVVFSIENREGVLGYSQTKLVTEKFPYICSKPSKSVESSKCLRIRGQPDSGLITDHCRMQRASGNAVPKGITFGCMPGGPLQVGDKLTFYSVQPWDPEAFWSFNLFSSKYFVSFHCGVRQKQGSLANAWANGPWGTDFIKGIRDWTPFPYRRGELEKTVIWYKPDELLITVFDRFSYAWPHKIRDYAYFGVLNQAIQNVTVTRGDKICGLPAANTTAEYWL